MQWLIHILTLLVSFLTKIYYNTYVIKTEFRMLTNPRLLRTAIRGSNYMKTDPVEKMKGFHLLCWSTSQQQKRDDDDISNFDIPLFNNWERITSDDCFVVYVVDWGEDGNFRHDCLYLAKDKKFADGQAGLKA